MYCTITCIICYFLFRIGVFLFDHMGHEESKNNLVTDSVNLVTDKRCYS